MSGAPSLVWFRQDLRLSDNPALAAAVKRGAPVVPVFIWAPEEEGDWPPGAASRWWLGRSLAELGAELEKRGSRLMIRRGPAVDALRSLASEAGCAAVFWNRRYEPAALAVEKNLERALSERGLRAESFSGSLLFEPWTIQNRKEEPFRIFTAFWRACLTRPIGAPSKDAPKRLPAPEHWPRSLELSELRLEPALDRAAGFREVWQPGETGARRRLKRFLREGLAEYPVNRDRPAISGTSRLSPHLHFGEISPGTVWRAVFEMMRERRDAAEAYLRQLAWREFAYHLLYHHPESPREALRREFNAFPWRKDRSGLEAWRRGRTGFPLVDAGLRELWRTGWMHNRVRMVAASFLVKHLLVDWREGAAWFWDTLVDADLANNALGWQWVAGCGADAAPYFRIFNPTIQAEKFDPQGDYSRRWVPVPGLRPPIVDHNEARDRALAALASMKGFRGKPHR